MTNSSRFIPSKYNYSLEKRILDLILSLSLTILLLPFMLVVFLFIKFGSSGPVIFKQRRVGMNGDTFDIFKFRTMYDGADRDQGKYIEMNIAPFPTFKIYNDPRFVGIGRLLSRYGIDELPQLINVIIGNMSMVGPRPLPISEAIKVPSSWKFRTLVKPGIFSSWAFSDRRKMTISKWQKLDRRDLEKGSVLYDIGVVLYTIIKIAPKWNG